MANLTLRNIRKAYDNIEVLHGIDLEIGSGEFIVFVGVGLILHAGQYFGCAGIGIIKQVARVGHRVNRGAAVKQTGGFQIFEARQFHDRSDLEMVEEAVGGEPCERAARCFAAWSPS